MIKYNTPQELFTAICNKIRSRTNSNELISHQDIPDKIDELVDNSNDSVIKYNQILSIMMRQSTIIEINNNIKSINIPLDNNQDLTIIDLPECTFICTFEYCKNLTTVNLPECTSIDGAFHGCTNLTTINLPKCTYIGDFAFSSTSLTIIDLPKCTYIGVCAFSSCTNLTTINLPECTYIEYQAFLNCANLTTLILNNDQIVTLREKSAFYGTPIVGIYNKPAGYVYVPDNLVESYKTATNWSTYANHIKPISELPSELKEEYNYL